MRQQGTGPHYFTARCVSKGPISYTTPGRLLDVPRSRANAWGCGVGSSHAHASGCDVVRPSLTRRVVVYAVPR